MLALSDFHVRSDQIQFSDYSWPWIIGFAIFMIEMMRSIFLKDFQWSTWIAVGASVLFFGLLGLHLLHAKISALQTRFYIAYLSTRPLASLREIAISGEIDSKSKRVIINYLNKKYPRWVQRLG